MELAASYPDDHFRSDDEDGEGSDEGKAEGDIAAQVAAAQVAAAQVATVRARRATLADTLERKSREELSKTMAEWDRQRSKAFSWMIGMCEDKVKEFFFGRH